MMIDDVQNAVRSAINSKYSIDDISLVITYPEPKFGDFSTNAAFLLAKRLNQPPGEVATELAAAIAADTGNTIAEAEAVNGFINMRMDNHFWVGQLLSITSEFGSSQLGKGRRVEVEFISANPTGPTTIGNARGGYIGDTLANVLAHSGYAVTREYYFNNAGTQIAKLLESVKVAAGLIRAEAVQYKGEYIHELASDFKAELAAKSDDELKELITQAILERWIRPAIDKMGIHFDSWFNERDLVEGGQLEETIGQLRKQNLVYDHEGALWLDTAKLGLSREARVLIKSTGDPTYLAPDIAFHDDLFGRRSFDSAIKILGADHVDQFPSVKAAVAILHPNRQLEVVVAQWFRLLKAGKEVKISKRLGQFVTIEELIDEVGTDVARFMTLMRSADTGMDFDLSLAKEQSQKNPLFYVMYSYARANSILDQASERGLTPISTVERLSEYEVALVRHMSKFPRLVADIAHSYEVHHLTFFGMQAAKLFHDLYESERIIDLDKTEACRRLYVIKQYIVFMEAYSKVLGITPVKRMERDTETA
ncbi:MAG TPA: arginine--tRNA ligase [Candidatus Saccharimonadia bacterium]